MRIFLPLTDEHEFTEPEMIAEALPNRRILYIDDDPRLRQLVSTLLEQLGQQVFRFLVPQFLLLLVFCVQPCVFVPLALRGVSFG